MSEKLFHDKLYYPKQQLGGVNSTQKNLPLFSQICNSFPQACKFLFSYEVMGKVSKVYMNNCSCTLCLQSQYNLGTIISRIFIQNIQKFRLSFQSFIIKSMVLQRYVFMFLLVCRLLCFSISKTNRFFSKQPVLERDHKLQNRSRFLSN